MASAQGLHCLLFIWHLVYISAGSKLGPVDQSIVSLTSSLMTNSLSVVPKVFSNTVIFGCKNVSSFCEATQIFSAKKINVFAILQDRHFNVTLANNFVKF